MTETDKNDSDSKNNYQILSKNSLFSITLLDLEGNIFDVNNSSEKLFGYKREELIGKSFTFLSIYPSGFIQKTKNLFQSIINGEFVEPLDIQIYNKRKNLIWVSIIGFLIKIGEKQLIQLIIQDIEKKVLLDQKIRQSEKKYRDLAEMIPDIIFEADLDLNLTYVNSSAFKQFGYTKKDFSNCINLTKCIDPIDLEKALTSTNQILNGEITPPNEYLLVKKDGKRFYARVHSRPIYKRGKVIGIRGVIHDISALIQSEQKLKESELKYRFLFEKSPFSILVMNSQGIIVDCNPMVEQLIGYSRDELIGKKYVELPIVKKEYKSLLLERLKELIKNECLPYFEVELVKKDGRIIWVILQSSLLKIGQERFIQVIGTDITPIKEAEEKLKESEEKYRLISENANDAIAIINENFELQYINENIHTKLTGYSKSDLLKKNSFDFIHPDDLSVVRKIMSKSGISGEGIAELRCKHKDGNYRWYEIKGKEFINTKQEKNYLLISRDINEKKLAAERLKESEEKFRTLIKNSPNLIFIFDHEGTVIDCNISAEKYMNLPRNKIINQKIYALLTSLSKEKTLSLSNKILQNIKENNYEPIEFVYKDRYNNKTWYQLYYSLLDIGEKSYIHVELQDFTELKNAEEIIKKENKRLMRMDKIRKNLIQTTSHELKTPLTSIYGANQLLYELNKDKLSIESVELIEIAKNGSENLKNVILNLLDISLLESNKFKINKQDYNLVEIIEDCIKNMKYQIRKRDHVVKLDLPPEFILKIDKSSIERVITNILSNAIKYTPIHGTITITLTKKDSCAELAIRDSGIGLTENEIKKLFKKFGVIKKPEDQQIDLDKDGTGLGLYICKEIIELHKGEIWATSEGRDHGATFLIKIPLK